MYRTRRLANGHRTAALFRSVTVWWGPVRLYGRLPLPGVLTPLCCLSSCCLSSCCLSSGRLLAFKERFFSLRLVRLRRVRSVWCCPAPPPCFLAFLTSFGPPPRPPASAPRLQERRVLTPRRRVIAPRRRASGKSARISYPGCTVSTDSTRLPPSLPLLPNGAVLCRRIGWRGSVCLAAAQALAEGGMPANRSHFVSPFESKPSARSGGGGAGADAAGALAEGGIP